MGRVTFDIFYFSAWRGEEVSAESQLNMSLSCLQKINRLYQRDSHVGTGRSSRARQHPQKFRTRTTTYGLLKGLFGNGSANGDSATAAGEVPCLACTPHLVQLQVVVRRRRRSFSLDLFEVMLFRLNLAHVPHSGMCQQLVFWHAAELIDTEKADFGSDPESIILSEMEGDKGKAKIVYRPGGEVDVGELASLCEKVGWPKRPSDKVAGALKNSFLVRYCSASTPGYCTYPTVSASPVLCPCTAPMDNFGGLPTFTKHV